MSALTAPHERAVRPAVANLLVGAHRRCGRLAAQVAVEVECHGGRAPLGHIRWSLTEWMSGAQADEAILLARVLRTVALVDVDGGEPWLEVVA